MNDQMLLLLGYIIIIGGAFYMFSVRPQKKRQNALKEMLEAMQPGDSVLTTSGFYGTVLDVMDDVVIVEFGNNKNCRIPMQREAIANVESVHAGEAQE